jgi:hypothetical protein
MGNLHNSNLSKQVTSEWFLSHFSKVRQSYGPRWMACCPAHDDRHPSLSINLEHDRILIHCFAGCRPEWILQSVGLSLSDLFLDRKTGGFSQKRESFQWSSFYGRIRELELVLNELEFRAEAMCDRASQLIAATHGADISTWTDEEHHRVLNMVADAFRDLEQVERLRELSFRFHQWRREQAKAPFQLDVA